VQRRPATLSKDILTQAEVLIALRMTGPRDVAAIDEWVRLHADEDEAREVKSSLASLPVGTAWVWSPGWLDLLRRVQIRLPRTFDSSATPRPGQKRLSAKAMAPIDLAALGEQITATVERGKAEDPRQLRRTIDDLQRQLRTRVAPAPVETVTVTVPVLDAECLAELRGAVTAYESSAEELRAVLGTISAKCNDVADPGRPAPSPQPARPDPVPAEPGARPAPTPAPTAAAPDGRLPKAQRAILSVLAQHGHRTTTQVALLTGYSHKSGGFRNSLSSLRSAELIEGRGDIDITPEGLRVLGHYEPLPTGPALIEWWKREQLGKAESAILDVLVEHWPAAVAVDFIAEATGYSATSGGFRNSLSRLRSLQLAAGRGELAVADTLMD